MKAEIDHISENFDDQVSSPSSGRENPALNLSSKVGPAGRSVPTARVNMSSPVTQLHDVDLYTVLNRLAIQIADTSVDLNVVECDNYIALGMREDCVKWGIAYEIC